MSIRRRCRGACRTGRRCLEHLWFDVTHDGKRFRLPVNDFAVPRMEPGKQRSIESMEEARDWERLFIGEIKAGRDPRLKPARKEKAPDIKHVAGFLDAYFEGHLKPAGIRSLDTAAGRLKVLKQYFGDLPVKALEEPAVINRFKAESEYARRVEIATLHKVLALLRASIRWGQAQTPPLIDKSPFHRFGVRLNVKAETVRDRRLSRDEEKRLLDAALSMNTWQHRFAGSLMHDRIIGALELCCRLGEMLLIQNKRVDWDTHTIGIPGHTTKDQENRRIPFDPNGRLAAVLRRRGKLGQNAFVFGTDDGDYVASFKTAWESLLLVANGHDTKRAKPGARVDRAKLQQIDLHWHDLRHEGACRLLADGVDIRIIQLMLGHASAQQTQRYLNVTDEELRKVLEVSWSRRTLKAVAGGSNA
jgi:integrase/recombinase XerC